MTVAVAETFEPIILRVVGDPQPEGNKRPLLFTRPRRGTAS